MGLKLRRKENKVRPSSKFLPASSQSRNEHESPIVSMAPPVSGPHFRKISSDEDSAMVMKEGHTHKGLTSMFRNKRDVSIEHAGQQKHLTPIQRFRVYPANHHQQKNSTSSDDVRDEVFLSSSQGFNGNRRDMAEQDYEAVDYQGMGIEQEYSSYSSDYDSGVQLDNDIDQMKDSLDATEEHHHNILTLLRMVQGLFSHHGGDEMSRGSYYYNEEGENDDSSCDHEPPPTMETVEFVTNSLAAASSISDSSDGSHSDEEDEEEEENDDDDESDTIGLGSSFDNYFDDFVTNCLSCKR